MRGSTRARSGRRAGGDATLAAYAGRGGPAATSRPTTVGGSVQAGFLDGAEVSCDGGSDLLARFAGAAVRAGRAAALSFAVVAGAGLAGAQVTTFSSEAAAAGWVGPTPTFWDIVRVKLRKVGGPDFETAFLHEVDVFQAACARSPGTGCRFEMAGVVLDFAADRYVVEDPEADDPLQAVQEDGVIVIVDGSTGHALDGNSHDAAWRITEWIMDDGDVEPGIHAEAPSVPTGPSLSASFR